MTTNTSRGSAKIYAFPARGRFAAGGNRDENKPTVNLTPSLAAAIVLGSAWYHDEAVQEAERTRKK